MPYKDPERRREYQREYQRRYREANREKRRETQREYRRRYCEANREKVRAARANSKAKRRGAPMLFSLTAADLKRMRRDQLNLCGGPTCLKPLADGQEMDHVIPVSRGGEHSPENLQLLCPGCSKRKQAIPPLQWIERETRSAARGRATSSTPPR